MYILFRAIAATTASFVGASVWTKVLSYLVRSKRLQPHSARKLMHITTAPLFAVTFPLYPNNFSSRILAGLVPLSFAVRIVLQPDKDTLVRAVARGSVEGKDGNADLEVYKKHAQGPISYAISISALTVLFWRSSATTYVSMAVLCFGDGMADVVGTTINSAPLPLPSSFFTKKKTLPGSLAFIVSSFTSALAFLKITGMAGVKPLDAKAVALVSVAGSIAELFPVEDNFTVPTVAAALCQVLK